MTKRIATLVPLLIFVTLLAACAKRDLPTDRPLDDGSYFYRNQALSFSLILPDTFEKYQTQRIESESFVDLEIFVPSSDTRFGKEVPGYAKPIVIRVYNKDRWAEIVEDGENNHKFLDKKGDKVYTIIFWENEPKDWQARWNSVIEDNIVSSFRVE